MLVDPADLELDEASAAELEAAAPTVRRNVEHLRDYAAREPTGKPRAIRLRFFSSPVAIHGDGKVEAIELVRNELVGGRAVPTEERETIPCGIVFRSVGYQGVPLPGLPFDEGSATIPNEGGRVEPGLYVAGWIKRGPSGVIGTNKKDATETVALLLDDARAGLLPSRERGHARGRCSRNVASTRCSTPAGRRSTRRSAAPASRWGVPGSSSAAGLTCSPPRRRPSSPAQGIPRFGDGRTARSDRQLKPWIRSTLSVSAADMRDSSPPARGGMRKQAPARAVSTWAGPTRPT